MQPTRSDTFITAMLHTQGAAGNEQMYNSESECCQLQVLGRTVSLSKPNVVFLTFCLPVCVSVSVPVMSVVSNPIGIGAFVAGACAGAGAGVFVGGCCQCMSLQSLHCRHVVPTDPSVQLSGVITHPPEATGGLAEICCEAEPIDCPATFRHHPEQPPQYVPGGPLPAYAPGEPPPAYAPGEPPPAYAPGEPPPPYRPDRTTWC